MINSNNNVSVELNVLFNQRSILFAMSSRLGILIPVKCKYAIQSAHLGILNRELYTKIDKS
jgi:hypothetical protein